MARNRQEDTMHVTQDDILRDPEIARAAYQTLMAAGEGWHMALPPAEELEFCKLVRAAATPDDVDVYESVEGDYWLYLVGTDGTDGGEGRWAVGVCDIGVHLDD